MLRMIFTHTIVAIICAIFIDATTTRADNCNQSCGFGKSAIRVKYPFGFSPGCQIPLNCSKSGGMQIGEFLVQNVTSDSIIINVPGKCNRTTETIEPLFDRSYALTGNNSLLLQNCSSQAGLNGCVIQTRMLENQFKLDGCDAKSDNISCYSEENGGAGWLSYKNVASLKCRLLFSSIAVDPDKGLGGSLDFQTAELGWWLEGRCNCSPNSNCTVVRHADGRSGFRCRCKEGFDGDGFADGQGCRKVSVSKCNASKYMSGRCGGTTRVVVLVGGIIAGASLVAGLALFCYFIRRRSTSLKSRMSARRLICEAAGSSSVPFFPYKEIERATNCFSEDRKAGNWGLWYSLCRKTSQW
ncbi:hypothetical protein L1049_023381 [Liquidambar formosana]|uniref:EGF-like domain-containing protein n=1 Tax=Liquidambar formosana TaxID=63359 RepID=A0AAP0WYS9_LIQFO